MERVKLATVWLGGCSGCHMSFLDLDEWLFDLADRVDLVYSPIADIKHFPTRSILRWWRGPSQTKKTSLSRGGFGSDPAWSSPSGIAPLPAT